MTATRADIAALLAAVEADPLDRAPRLILADAVEEAGDAEGSGLLRAKEPMRSFMVPGDYIWFLGSGPRVGITICDLPPATFGRLMGGHERNELRVRYKTAAIAYADLARAVVRAAREARP
jgi:uncharacterized protein (TIGR02996 family)